ncbi:MAG: dihydroorotase [Oscillospiraceae bacterium]|nr:dihydroorotase [Oscillospiraceae bacterium]
MLFLFRIRENSAMRKKVSVYENGGFAVREFELPKRFVLSDNSVVLPGLADVHVHFREPGFSYKETVLSGCAAALAGGYTAVCTMPNLSPVPDCAENLLAQLRLINAVGGPVRVYPYGSVTRGEKGEELSDMDALAPYVVAFSDDGRGVQSEDIMLAALKKARSLDRIVAAHCEDASLLDGGYIHKGAYAAAHGHRGISSESEWRMLERDLRLVRATGAAYHMCHVSTRESVELIRRAKREGLDVSCETAPHYLVLDDSALREDGRFKMNPPIRSEKDRMALLEGVCDGTVDMIATDHAPHSAEEKAGGLEKSLMGVVGLETAFPVLYTHLVKTGIVSLEKLVALMSENPRRRFGIPPFGAALFDLDAGYVIDPSRFLSRGRSTPFEGMSVYGRHVRTAADPAALFEDEETEAGK